MTRNLIGIKLVHIDGLDRPEDLGFVPQPMVRWLGPRGLAVTGAQVLLSGIFGAYSDKREIQAALKESTGTDLSHEDELWVDWLADTGDGFDATYSTIMALARPTLDLSHEGQTHRTPRGRVLVLGGDLAYPAAAWHEYHNRFTGPFEAAFPRPPEGEPPPVMLVCAGNHDWYDGLTTFLRLFCEEVHIGGWQTEQTRSYFVLHLPHGWWLFGIDLAFETFIDEPQLDFFRHVATDLAKPGDKVILATHRPSWIFGQLHTDELFFSPASMSNLQRFEHEVIHKHGLKLPVALGGDIHHYNRYARQDGSHQRITAAAGGTFLHPTHNLPPGFSWPDGDGQATYTRRAVYPDAKTSRRLRWGILLAPYKNPSFIAFMAGIYVVFVLGIRFAVAPVVDRGLLPALQHLTFRQTFQILFDSPVTYLLILLLGGAMIVFVDASRWRWRIIGGLIHGTLHLLLIVWVIWGLAHLLYPTIRTAGLDLVVIAAAVGGVLGAQLIAIYLWFMQTVFRKHATHSFSSQRIPDWRSFLRMHLDRDGNLTIYPIAIRKVPRRWRQVRDRASHEPWFEPVDRPIECELIEAPIKLDAEGDVIDAAGQIHQAGSEAPQPGGA